MEVVVSYYSLWWFVVSLVGITLFAISGYLLLAAEKPSERHLWQLLLATAMIFAGNGFSSAPETNAVTLAPGEELVGSGVSGMTAGGMSKVSVIVRLSDGKFSVRDFRVPPGKQLEIRSSTPIEQ